MRRSVFSATGDIVLIHALVLGLLVVLASICYSMDLPPEQVLRPASLVLVALSLWSLWSWRRVTKSLFDPYVLFWIAAVLFNGGQAFLEVLSLNEDGLLSGEFSPDIVLRTLILVIVGLAAFHLGGLIGASGSRGDGNRNPGIVEETGTAADARLVGWGLLAISIIPAIYLAREAVRTVMAYGYFGLFQREGPTGFGAAPAVLGAFLVPAAIFLLAGSKENRAGRVASGAIMFLYFVIHLFLGSRSAAVMPMAAYTWVWHRRIRPLPSSLLLGAGFVVLILLLPLIQLIRNLSGEERSTLPFIIEAFLNLEHPAVAIVSEMGGSMGTVAHTIDLVPGARGYDLGTGYMYAISTIVPNLFWEIHPAVAHGLAANWLIWTVDPITAGAGGGLGFSFIAEAYLNFGWYGTPAALGIIGFLFGTFVSWGERGRDPARTAALASFLAFFLMFVRGETAIILRPLVWYSLIPYLLVQLLGWHRSMKWHAASLRLVR